jgi:hypothetical protein
MTNSFRLLSFHQEVEQQWTIVAYQTELRGHVVSLAPGPGCLKGAKHAGSNPVAIPCTLAAAVPAMANRRALCCGLEPRRASLYRRALHKVRLYGCAATRQSSFGYAGERTMVAVGNDTNWAAAAAWVQAILSAGAVLLAVWLQDRSIQMRARAARHERLQALAGFLDAALAATARARDVILRLPPPTIVNGAPLHTPTVEQIFPDKGAKDQLETVLMNVPLHELPSPALAMLVITARAQFAKIEDELRVIRGQYEGGHAPPDPLAGPVTVLSECAREFRREMGRLDRKPGRRTHSDDSGGTAS